MYFPWRHCTEMWIRCGEHKHYLGVGCDKGRRYFVWHFGIQNARQKTSCVPKQINLVLLLSNSRVGTLVTYLSPKIMDFSPQIIFKKTDTKNDKSQAYWMKSPTHVQYLHLIVVLVQGGRWFLFTILENKIYNLTVWPGYPLTPTPVTRKVLPDSGYFFNCSSLRKIFAVVTYSSSRWGPPNATDVTWGAGILIWHKSFPLSGSTRTT